MSLTGQLIVGFDRVSTAQTFRAIDSARGAEIDPPISIAGPQQAAYACELAEAAFDAYREIDIERFLRPVCYQDVPDDLLAPELRDENPLRLRRLVDGRPS